VTLNPGFFKVNVYLEVEYQQETQLSLTNSATHLCKCDGVADLLKHAIPIYHVKFGRSTPKGVGINTGEPPKLGALELRSLRMGGVADPTIHVLPQRPTCYHVKFSSPETKDVCTNRSEPPKLGSVGDPPLGVVHV